MNSNRQKITNSLVESGARYRPIPSCSSSAIAKTYKGTRGVFQLASSVVDLGTGVLAHDFLTS
jgi:hypothetical protein